MRNERSLIQTIGRAARNENGHVIMYADHVTDSMQAAMYETQRRREIQEQYNQDHHITPHTIKKDIREAITVTKETDDSGQKDDFTEQDFADMAKDDQKEMVHQLEEQMKAAAKRLDFEQAATLRDTVMELKTQMD